MAEQHTDALDQLLELVVLLDDDMTQSLAREGLTVPRAHLAWLVHHNGPTTQRELAEALKVTPRNVTGLVDGLVAGGFVTRERHPTDRRATLVALTERGAASLAEMEKGHRDLAALLFGDMAERELDAFVEALGDVTSRLREGLQAAGEGGR
ncbi:MAG TPA: MarR family transcriptional regulator [Solirubrobacteraceae bacterium]|nr:MarR family transcriptional regulator [Solirubrobacteraceae bacterium]